MMSCKFKISTKVKVFLSVPLLFLILEGNAEQRVETKSLEKISVKSLVAPAPPNNLVVKNVTSDSIKINWSASNSAIKYYVFWSGGQAVATGTSYTINNLQPNKQYYVKVSAVNSSGKASSYSALKEMTGTVVIKGVDDTTLMFQDLFQQEDGLISNEYAFWNARFDNTVVNSNDWALTSGSFFAQGQSGWTGVPDSCKPDKLSENCTNSNTFRLKTKQAFAGKTKVSFSIRQNKDIHDDNCKSKGTCWSGTHIWLRHQNQYNLYYASIQRVDGKVVIKRKVPCGKDNKGYYASLSQYKPHDWVAGRWMNYAATIDTQADGSVKIELFDEDESTTTPVAVGVDKGGINPNWNKDCKVDGHSSSAEYSPITEAGSVGIRSDNANFNIRNFTVHSKQKEVENKEVELVFNTEQRLIADQFISIFENGSTKIKYDYAADIGDGRGITAGRAGFTSATGDMLKVIQKYTKVVPDNSLAKYQDELKKLVKLRYQDNNIEASGSTKGLGKIGNLIGDWEKNSENPIFRKIQDQVVAEEYLNPALKRAKDLGLKYPLSLLSLYDTNIMHGAGGPKGLDVLISKATQMTNKRTPKNGAAEIEWLKNFNKARKTMLKNEGGAWGRALARVTELEDLIDDRNTQLIPFSMEIETYGYESHELPTYY